MNSTPRKYARFVGEDGKSALNREEFETPEEGMVVESKEVMYMIDENDDYYRWAKNMFLERPDQCRLNLWSVTPHGRIQEGTDDMFDIENDVYPEFVCRSMTYNYIIYEVVRTMSADELSCLFNTFFAEGVAAGFDDCDAWTYARLSLLDIDFVRLI